MRTLKSAGLCALALMALAPATGAEVRPPTRVAFFFDTEDYTCDRSNDAIRDLAKLLTEEGVRGNFNVVGYLGQRLVELRRTDVIDALRPHVLGTQTLYHSRHPDIAEIGDDPDYTRAYDRTRAEEARGVELLEAAFGKGRIVFACPPGNSVSAVAMDVYSDLGIRVNAATGICGLPTKDGVYGAGMLVRSGTEVDGLWYFNQYQVPYYEAFGLESLLPGSPSVDMKAELDKMAKFDFIGLYMHPHMAVKRQHWDGPNYAGGNNCEWGKWKQVPDRDPKNTAEFYERLRGLLRTLKADPRFQITDLDEMTAALKPRRTISRADIPFVRAALRREFGPVREPASWCVADVFQAAVRLLRDEAPVRPGKVRGFLARPKGVSRPVRVSAAAVRAAAAKIDLESFLPSELDLGGGVRIGPADFLFAALEVLETGSETVELVPRPQLGSFKEIPTVENLSIAGKWLHTSEFKDEFLSERLRLQLWTMRFE